MKRNSAEVIKSIESIVANNLSDHLVGAEYTGRISMTGKDFPKLFMFQTESATAEENVNRVNLSFRLLDVAESQNNKQRKDYEIKSDMTSVASMLIDYMWQENIIVNTDDISIDPITVAEGDGLSGVEFNIAIPLLKPITPYSTSASQLNFRAITIGQLIDTTDEFTIAIDDATVNDSGLSGTFVSISTDDDDLNISLNEAKTILTLQTDNITSRFSNINFTASNGVVTSSGTVVCYVSDEIPAPFSFGNALKFDGVNDYCVTDVNTFSNLLYNANGKYTISLWIKPIDLSNSPIILSNASATSNFFFQLDANESTIYVGKVASGVFRTYTGASILMNQWNNFVITKTGLGNQFNLYLNGALLNTFTGAVVDIQNTNDRLYIGRYNSGFYANVVLDLITIYNGVSATALDAIDFYNAGNGANPPDLIASPSAMWELNESGSTLIAPDTGSLGYNLTLVNFVSPPEFWIEH